MRSLWTAFLILLACGPLCADGAFFKSGLDLKAEVAEPNQKALLLWDGRRETLVLQVTYRGGAGRFGWVVPVPSRPKLDTASGDLFLELAEVTKPVEPARQGLKEAAGSRGAAMQAAAVQVIERVEVGPYDATVLAASEANALAEWLRRNGYRMPKQVSEVLDSYVKRKWYYVALHVKTQRDVLAEFRKLVPTLTSAEKAPEQVAAEVARLDLSRPRVSLDRSKGMARAIERIRAETSGVSERYRGRLGGEEFPYVSFSVDNLRRVLDEYEGQLVSREQLQGCLSKCASAVGWDRFQAAAYAVGLRPRSMEDNLLSVVADSLRQDLCRGVPYTESRLNKLQDHLRGSGRRISGKVRSLAFQYDLSRRALALVRPAPLSEQQKGDLEEAVSRANSIEGPLMPLSITYLVASRDSLYRQAEQEVRLAIEAADDALRGGTIRPLRLDFDTAEMVYPLYISKLNPGGSDIQLYTLGDHRMTAEGFRTDFAGRLEGEAFDRRRYQAVAAFARGTTGTTYLTELRAEMTPAEMKEDLTFTQAWSDREYRQRRGGLFTTRTLLALLAAGVATLVILRRVFRRQARRATPVG